MPRLIDANKLMDYINDNINEMTNIGVAVDAEYLWGLINYAIEDAPTIDAVEVVRCKECKSAERKNKWYCVKRQNIVNDDDFCSRGERREDA